MGIYFGISIDDLLEFNDERGGTGLKALRSMLENIDHAAARPSETAAIQLDNPLFVADDEQELRESILDYSRGGVENENDAADYAVFEIKKMHLLYTF